jgi:hypothetical protein
MAGEAPLVLQPSVSLAERRRRGGGKTLAGRRGSRGERKEGEKKERGETLAEWESGVKAHTAIEIFFFSFFFLFPSFF